MLLMRGVPFRIAAGHGAMLVSAITVPVRGFERTRPLLNHRSSAAMSMPAIIDPPDRA